MKVIEIIKLCVALLLAYVPDGVRTESITQILDGMAKNGQIVYGIFKPSKGGLMGSGLHGTIIYKGKLVRRNKIDVAMKFSKSPRAKEATKNEHNMYCYLDAIDGSSVEAYGIPSIHYYDTWEGYTMMAMKLRDSPFGKDFDVGKLTELNLLIVFREFVRAIKYIHSRGIINNNIQIENMMSQNGRGFMFDFGKSVHMVDSSPEEYISRIKKDFQQLLFSNFGSANFINIVDKVIQNDRMNKGKKPRGLQRVFGEFTEYAYNYRTEVSVNENETSIPFYDYLYGVIIEELQSYGEEATASNPSISSIPGPFETLEWLRSPV